MKEKNTKKSALANVQVAVDVVVFTLREGKISVLLHARRNDPYKGKLALPGGFLWEGETTMEAAKRVLKSKTGQDKVYVEQLYSFDNPKRDPRGRVISVTYFALTPEEFLDNTKSDKLNAHIYSVDEVGELPFDHNQIINYALVRLRSKLLYTNVAYSLLPDKFTLTSLQLLYEGILGRKLDKRNFRKKYLSLGLIESTGKYQTGAAHRPALLYKFKSHNPTELEEPAF